MKQMYLTRVDGQLKRANGTLIRSEITIEANQSSIDVVLHSRGGTSGSSSEQNPDYYEALEELLRRLGHADAVVRAILVDSTRVAKLSEPERLLNLPFPIRPAKYRDLDRLRKDITGAQQSIGQSPGSKGGNPTRRIRLRLDRSSLIPDAAALVSLLGGAGGHK